MAKKSQAATKAEKAGTSSEKPSPAPHKGTQVAVAAKKNHWPPHPIAELFPAMIPEEFSDLKKDMVERLLNGLDPLEHAIILLDDKILDGRHRD